MEGRDFVVQARIDVQTLEAWTEAGWLAPQRQDERPHYSAVDVARAHLIEDLKHLGINDEGIPVILDLVDQLHGVRRVLRELLSTVQAQQQEPGRS
jgi:chaperone modulatory protein CbpM